MTSEADRQRLLRIAREALAAHVAGTPVPEAELTGAAARLAGAFVTLRAARSSAGASGTSKPTSRSES